MSLRTGTIGSHAQNDDNPVSNMMHTRRTLLILLFLIAFAVRLIFAYIGFVYPDPGSPGSDSMRFDAIGLNLSTGGGFVVDGLPATDRAPLYCFFLAAIYFLFGHNYAAVIFFQSLIGAFTCLLVFGIARKIFKEDVALLSYILSATFPPLIAENNFIMSEPIYTFLSCAMVYCFLEYQAKPRPKNAAFSGLMFGVGVLGRPVFAAQHFFTMCFMLVHSIQMRLRRCFLPVAIFFISSLIVVTPWVIRNYSVAKRWIFVTEYNGHSILQASFNDLWFFELADRKKKLDKVWESGANGYIIIPYDAKRVGTLDYIKAAFFNISKSPARYIKASLKRLLNLVAHSYAGSLGLEEREAGKQSFVNLKNCKLTSALLIRLLLVLLYVAIYILAIVGAFSKRSVINRSARAYTLSYLVLHVAVIAFTTLGVSRYYAAAYPLVMICSSAGIRRIR